MNRLIHERDLAPSPDASIMRYPGVIRRSDGHVFRVMLNPNGERRIYAGCRIFTRRQAEKHWGPKGPRAGRIRIWRGVLRRLPNNLTAKHNLAYLQQIYAETQSILKLFKLQRVI